MRWTNLLLGSGLVVSAIGSIAAGCGGDDATAAPPGDAGDATTPVSDGPGTPDADIPEDGIPAEFGIDERPTNTTCFAPTRPPSSAPAKFIPVFGTAKLATPVAMRQIPTDATRFYVLQRGGQVVWFTSDAPATVATAYDVKAKLTLDVNGAPVGEGGLLGFAFHPSFATNGYLYLSYTTPSATSPANMASIITRVTSADGGKTFDPKTEVTILGPFDQPATNHNGGNILFGPDGYLYAGFGDGGGSGDQFKHGQDTNGFFAKILRVDVDHPDSGKMYGVPADNPFKSGGGEPATYAWGFRNPWRWSFDRGSGDLWVGDVGQDAWEEIDAKVKLNGNYGWNCREGLHGYLGTCLAKPGFIDPIYEYDHVVDGKAKSVTGGYVYRGKAMPKYAGTYVFADFIIGKIWSLAQDLVTGAYEVTLLNPAGPFTNWASFAEDNDGEIYAVGIGGNIYKMVPNAAAGGGGDAGADGGDASAPPPFPDKLSATGCVDPANPKNPAAALIPYGVNSPLWSDGATKNRWMALPAGKQIHIEADGHWDFPIGSVLMKEFSVDGKRVETRLFVRHNEDGGWAGYTYAWDDAETDATLLPSNETRPLPGGKSWYYPSRSECITCHNAIAGRTLGTWTGELNGDYRYPNNRRSNQMITLAHIGLFDAPLPAPKEQLDQFPDPAGAAPVEDRARSYLQANCSFCHRPNGFGGGTMDLRYATPFAASSACNAAPQNGDQGVAGAKIVTPGNPALSLLSVRPHALDAKRMPPVGTRVVDAVGTGVIDQWITQLASCPAAPVDSGFDAKD